MSIVVLPRSYFEVVELNKGLVVNTINLEGLLLTKKTAREKDRVDRMVIERALALLENKQKS